MKSITLFSNKKNYKEAAGDIIEQARSRVDFEPDLALFYATLKYNGKYQSMLDIFHEEYGDIPQVGASVDGMIYPDDIHTDGAALVLCEDEDARICVEGVKEKGSMKSAEKLAQKVKCEKGVIVLHFPLVHVPDALKSAEIFAKGFYYSNRCKRAGSEKQKDYAGKFADYCDKEKIFYLPPTVLNIFAKYTDYKVPIIGINAMHTQIRFNSPSIFCNFEDIDGGIAALTIEKEGVNAVYDDIFPDKGKTLEETRHIVNNEFTVIKQFKASFEKNILISLDNKPVVETIKDMIEISQKNKDDLIKQIGKGDFQAYTPYTVVFFNKKTNGVLLLGMGSYYPFELFPFFVDISDYSKDVILAYDPVYNKYGKFISSLECCKYTDKFKFFCIDIGTCLAFGNKTFRYKDDINYILKRNYFGALSAAPSIYIPATFNKRACLSELEQNTYFATGGSNLCLEI